MVAVQKIWDAMEVAQEARDCSSSEIHSSQLTVDTSLSLSDNHMSPRLMFVPSSFLLLLSLSITNGFLWRCQLNVFPFIYFSRLGF